MEFVIQRILRDFGKTSAHKQTLINLVVKKANEINEKFNTTPEKLMRLNQYLNQLMSPVSSYYAERDWLISIAQITTNYISDLLRVSSEVSIQKKTETKPIIDVYIQRMLNLMNIGTETNAPLITVYHPDPLNTTSYNLPISHTNALDISVVPKSVIESLQEIIRLKGNNVANYNITRLRVLYKQIQDELLLTDEQIQMLDSSEADQIAYEYVQSLVNYNKSAATLTSQIKFDENISIDELIGKYLSRYSSSVENKFNKNEGFTYDTSSQVVNYNETLVQQLENKINNPLLLIPWEFVLKDGNVAKSVIQKIKIYRLTLQYVETTTVETQQKIDIQKDSFTGQFVKKTQIRYVTTVSTYYQTNTSTVTDEPTYEPTTATEIKSGKWETIETLTTSNILDEEKVYGEYTDYIYQFVSPRGTDVEEFAKSENVLFVSSYAITDVLTGNVYDLIPGILDFKIEFGDIELKQTDETIILPNTEPDVDIVTTERTFGSVNDSIRTLSNVNLNGTNASNVSTRNISTSNTNTSSANALKTSVSNTNALKTSASNVSTQNISTSNTNASSASALKSTSPNASTTNTNALKSTSPSVSTQNTSSNVTSSLNVSVRSLLSTVSTFSNVSSSNVSSSTSNLSHISSLINAVKLVNSSSSSSSSISYSISNLLITWHGKPVVLHQIDPKTYMFSLVYDRHDVCKFKFSLDLLNTRLASDSIVLKMNCTCLGYFNQMKNPETVIPISWERKFQSQRCPIYFIPEELFVGDEYYINNLSYTFANTYGVEGHDSFSNYVNIDKLETSRVTTMSHMFDTTVYLTDIDILTNWITTSLTDLSFAFRNTDISDVSPLRNWATENVETMESTFENCTFITSISPLSSWDVSSLTNVKNLFSGCVNLSDISALYTWKPSPIEEISGLLRNCSSITSVDFLKQWDISKVTDISYLFAGCSSVMDFSILENINSDNLTSIAGLLQNCSNVSNIEYMSDWNLTQVTDISYLFSGCSSLSDISALESWNVLNIENAEHLFENCASLSSIDSLSNWNMPNVQYLSSLFAGCTNLSSISALENWQVSLVQDITYMFSNCTSLTDVSPLASWTFGEVTAADGLYEYCSKITYANQLISNKLPKLVSANRMFYHYTGNEINVILNSNNLTSIDEFAAYSNVDKITLETSALSITSFNNIFYGTTAKEIDLTLGNLDNEVSMQTIINDISSTRNNLEKIGLHLTSESSSFDNFDELFKNFTKLKSIDLRGTNLGGIVSAKDVFTGCNSLKTFMFDKIAGFPNIIYEADVKRITIQWNRFTSSTYVDSTIKNVVIFENGLEITRFGESTTMVSWERKYYNLGTFSISYTDAQVYGIVTLTDNYVNNLKETFVGCSYSRITQIPIENIGNRTIGNIDTTNVQSMEGTFKNSTELTTLSGLDLWNTSNVTSMSSMFEGCTKLTDISSMYNWDMNKTQNISNMFYGCSRLTQINLKYLMFGSINNAVGFLDGCSALTTVVPRNVAQIDIASDGKGFTIHFSQSVNYTYHDDNIISITRSSDGTLTITRS